MELLEKLARKASQAEVFTVESESTQVSFEANAMKTAQVEETQGVALRGIVNGRLGFTAASGRASEEQLIESLLVSAQFGEQVPLAFPGQTPGSPVVAYDPKLAEVPIARFVELGREIIARLLEADADAKVGVSIERGVIQSALHNSAGADLQRQASSFSLSIGVDRVRGDDVLMAFEVVNGISLSDEYQEATARLARKLAIAKRSATLKSGRMPVLFSPTGGLVLALPIMLGINGKNVQRGVSPLSKKVGEKILDGKLTVWDDPTLAGRPGSASHDDEGVACRKKAVIQQGVCQEFLYDLKTAALMGTASSGNGARSLLAAPSPSPSNLVIQSGETPVEKMLAGIEHGLLVEDVLGLGQGNALSGAFSNTLGMAYVIERGEIVGRVKDVSIAGNIYEDLKEVAAVSRESQWVYGQFLMPYILLGELNVVCKE